VRSISKLGELEEPYQASLLMEHKQDIFFAYNVLLEDPLTSQVYEFFKRLLDICGALLGLFVLALLLPLISFLIVLEDHGPIFYAHVRIGQHGQPFTTYKLRSMMVDADAYLKTHPELLEAWEKSGKLERDPRITHIGNILRRTSLDELPQLVNVLRGEMSLVGPRAIQFSEIERFGELIELRQMVKPGLTGLWQVSGRSMTDYEQRSILDCTYVLNRSFWMDVHILLKTIPAVYHGVGAY
jgi:exopolysaccharide production protein ExoY